jgi:hypothetical protein
MKLNIQQITKCKNYKTKLHIRHVLTALKIPYDSRAIVDIYNTISVLTCHNKILQLE